MMVVKITMACGIGKRVAHLEDCLAISEGYWFRKKIKGCLNIDNERGLFIIIYNWL
jgi:hypothetical protein